MEQHLANVERDLGTQIVVLIVPTTQPEDIAAYAQRVGDQWKIGRRDVGDGVLIVVAKNDRRIRIEVAKALEGAIPDLAARQIITETISPAFKRNDYAGGLNAAIDRLGARIKPEGLPAPERKGAAPTSGGGFDWQDLAMFFFVGVPIIGAVLTGIFGRKLGSLVTGGVAGAAGWWFSASLLVAGLAGAVALFLVGVMGFGASGLGAAARRAAGDLGWRRQRLERWLGRRRILIRRRRRLRRRRRVGRLVGRARDESIPSHPEAPLARRDRHPACAQCTGRRAPARARGGQRAQRTPARSASASKPGCRCRTCGAA